ncbi:MAG: heavy metal translocating P-type ATPase [Eubacteriaceae bacterium]
MTEKNSFTKAAFEIEGMSCTACAAAIERKVNSLNGVDSAVVNFATEKLVVSYDPAQLNSSQIEESISGIGYKAIPENNDSQSQEQRRDKNRAEEHLREKKHQMIAALVFAVPLFYLSMGPMAGLPIPSFLSGEKNILANVLTQLLLCLPVLYIGSHFYIDGFKALWHRIPNMDSLIAVGTSAAFFYSVYMFYQMLWSMSYGDTMAVTHHMHDIYFESTVVIIALISVGKYLESRAKGKTSQAIEKLIELAPDEATVLINGEAVVVPTADVKVGSIVLIKPGERIPVDGVITEGHSAVDESLLTGESIPVEKKVGSTVIAGSINKTGSFEFEASKIGNDTTLSRIITLVEEAQSSKAPISQLADEISRWFVPAVMIIALAAFLIWLLLGYGFSFALSIGIAVLVISCPCALGLATPTAIMVGTGVGASQGILFRNGEALETLGKANVIVFDKTGTLTVGEPEVTDFIEYSDLPEDLLLADIAGLEARSEHPLSLAVVEDAQKKGLTPAAVTQFTAVPGMGIEGQINGHMYAVGNMKLMEKSGTAPDQAQTDYERLSDEGKTPLFVARDGKLAAVIAVADVLKETSAQAVAQLKAMGLEVYMLTGDNRRTAQAIARQAGITHVIADVLPDQKAGLVKALQQKGNKLIMVGDGINDAPALAQADTGVAIGSGTDVAIESADVILMQSNLMQIPAAIQLSTATIKNIKMNLFWAFFYNTICIPLAAGVLYIPFGIKLNAMFAAAAMSLSSFCVVMNALSLRRFKPRIEKVEITHGDVQVETVAEVSGMTSPACPVLTDDSSQAELNRNSSEKKKDAINESAASEQGETMTITLNVKDMSCAHCSGRVEAALKEQPGVKSAEVSLEKAQAVIQAEPGTDAQKLADAVSAIGYPSSVA